MHTVCHFDLPSTNLEKSKSFYEKLFGWKIDTFSDENLICMLHETESGGFYKVDKITPSLVSIYYQVEDIPATLEKAVSLGGKILNEKRSIGEHGYIASFEDTCNCKIDIWSQN